MTFQSPAYLLLLLVLPYFIWLAAPHRKGATSRDWISLALRITLILCLIFGLAGLSLTSQSNQLAVLYLLDISDSVSPAQQAEAQTFIKQSLETKPPDDQAGMIVFGNNALVEIPLSTAPNINDIQSVPSTTQTDMAEALTLAQALFPANRAKRVVLFSDGLNTQGNFAEAVRIASANDVDILTIPLERESTADVAVTDLQLPGQLFEGEQFDLAFTLYASADSPATVRVLSGGQVLSEQSLQLSAGEESYAIPLVANQPGLQDFSIQIATPNDTVIQNNQLSGITFISGAPKVLVVAVPTDRPLPNGEPRPDEYSALLQALENGNFDYELIQPELLPNEPAQFLQYSAVLLVNVPGRTLSPAQMRALQSYIRDLGGGLVTIGGPTSYGLGGYYRTPLEETLPVNMRNNDEIRRTSVTLVYVIDRSGSMSDNAGRVSKLDLAKEAVMRSVELLFPKDKVGVIAFDDRASWIVPIQEVGDGTEIINQVGTLNSGGGTDILAGVDAVAEALPADDAQVKHVILLTDGGADPRGIADQVISLHQEHNITMTSIGIGSDAAAFLEDLAVVGGGRYHFVADPQAIPSIFTEETTLATQSYLVEESFTPRLGMASPILSGISGLPPLNGYVTTSPKNAATVALLSHQDDPILVSWQYGLGRSVAYTSDASGRWAGNWLRWDGFAPFWGQVVSYVSAPPAPSNIALDMETTEGKTTLSVDAQDLRGASLNGLDMTANLVSQGSTLAQVQLTQVGAGRYEAEVDALEPGSYAIALSGIGEGGENFVEQFGWIQSYSSEYKPDPEQESVLPEIAFLAPPTVGVDEIFKHNLRANSALHPLWQNLLTIAAFLLVLDIASRRLLFSQEDFAKNWKWLKKRFMIGKAKQEDAVAPSARLSSLQKAKERAQEKQGTEAPLEREEPIIIEAKAATREEQTKQESADSTASILLTKKRGRKQNRD